MVFSIQIIILIKNITNFMNKTNIHFKNIYSFLEKSGMIKIKYNIYFL